MLLADHRSQPILSACDEQKRGRQQHHCNQQCPIGHGDEREACVERGTDGAEQGHESAVSHPEGIPHVSDETEYEGQVERDRSHKPEISKLVRLQVQLVFKKKTDRDVDQTAVGRAEGEQYNQYAEIEENPPPHQRR